MGESIASFHAAFICRDHGLHDIIFEGDAKQLVDVVYLTTSRCSRFGHLIEDT